MTARIVPVVTLAAIAIAAALAIPANAHGDAHASHATGGAARAAQTPFGIAGDPAKVSRTIDMSLTDDMRFVPGIINVDTGETIRFRLRNTGRSLHEMVIGTLPDLRRHAAAMATSPRMHHDEPNMVHVQPGATGEIVWTFNRAGEFGYACLIPGHFEAGMIGKAIVKALG